MDRRFVATLALRLLGIFVLLEALLPLGYMASGIVQALTREGLGLEYAVGSFLSLLLLLVFGVALLVVAPTLASRWVAADEPFLEAGGLTPRALELLGYRLLGVYALVTNAPSLFSYLGSYAGLASEGAWDFLTRELLTALLETAIGLWLLFGARGLATLVDRARGAGLQEAEKAWKSP